VRLLRKALAHTARPGLKGLVSCVIERESPTNVSATEIEHTASLLEERIHGMPAHLSIGMLGLTSLFELSALVKGKRASKLDTNERREWMKTWREAPLGPARDFILFYDKMSAFAFHSLREHQ